MVMLLLQPLLRGKDLLPSPYSPCSSLWSLALPLFFRQPLAAAALDCRVLLSQTASYRAETNTKLRNGEWYAEEVGLIKEGMTLGELRESLAQHYCLNDEVRERLVLRHYRDQSTEGSKPKPLYVDNPEKGIPT